MKFKAAQLLSPNFIPAVNSLLTKDMDMPQCIAFTEAIHELEGHIKTCDTVRKTLIEKYVKKDDKGQPLFTDSKKTHLVFVNPESEQAFLKETEELLQQDFEIKFEDKIKISKGDKMSPQNYMLIKDFIDFVTE